MIPSLTTFNGGSLLFCLITGLLLCDAKAEWVETSKLVHRDGEEGDEFGYSVALNNGILVVGARFDNVGDALSAGSVTIFERVEEAWVAQQQLTASDGNKDDYFGTSVAIYNETLAVGAPRDDGGVRAGAVYTYGKGADGVWTERQKLNHSSATEGDHFGRSLAMQGKTLIVGARGHDSERGAAFVYTLLAGGIWTQAAKLRASDGRARDYFGTAVAIDSDTILVGARWDDNKSGSAYVFQRRDEGSSWMQVAKLKPNDGEPLDNFGRTVALEGGTLFVGSFNNVDGENAGAVYQFGKEEAAWTQQNKLVARDISRGGHFGLGLAVRDGTLIVGAYRQDGETGGIYVFQQVSEDWEQQTKLVASDQANGDRFGKAVAVEDGLIIVGANRDNSSRGSVYTVEWRASETSVRPSVVPTLQPTAKLSTMPSARTSVAPTTLPTWRPSPQPTLVRSSVTPVPTVQSTDNPTTHPATKASNMPSEKPAINASNMPSEKPSIRPSIGPSQEPSNGPSNGLSKRPSDGPSNGPLNGPTIHPTWIPSAQPTIGTSRSPTLIPSTFEPSGTATSPGPMASSRERPATDAPTKPTQLSTSSLNSQSTGFSTVAVVLTGLGSAGGVLLLLALSVAVYSQRKKKKLAAANSTASLPNQVANASATEKKIPHTILVPEDTSHSNQTASVSGPSTGPHHYDPGPLSIDYTRDSSLPE